MPFQIVRNDITKVKSDAIVNTANPKPVIGSGTDGAVYRAAGEKKLLAERRKIGDIKAGDAVYTSAFKLNAKYIIHTVGPVWVDGNHGEREILRSCYSKSLALADELKCKSIAFPLISSGAYRFPKDEALNIALSEIGKFLLNHDMDVVLVVFDKVAFELSENLMGDIEQFIDEHTVAQLHKDEAYAASGFISNIDERRIAAQRANMAYRMSAQGVDEELSGKSLNDILSNKGKTFQQRLFELIDESGMDDVAVYKKANIDRKLFSHIRSSKNYKPKKKTAVAFAIALELDLSTTRDLLQRAEIAFSESNPFDLIIEYFITKKIYNIFEINAALFQYGQPTLGC